MFYCTCTQLLTNLLIDNKSQNSHMSEDSSVRYKLQHIYKLNFSTCLSFYQQYKVDVATLRLANTMRLARAYSWSLKSTPTNFCNLRVLSCYQRTSSHALPIGKLTVTIAFFGRHSKSTLILGPCSSIISMASAM